MSTQEAMSAWPATGEATGSQSSPDSSQELHRLWLGFMTTRVMLSILLVTLQFVLLYADSLRSSLLLVICTAYFGATLSMRLLAKPGTLGHVLNGRWLGTVGLDLLMFSALQIAQGSSINYVPLFALPILMASVLGSLLLAMGAAAAATLFLLGQALWITSQAPWDVATQFLQAALTGTGCFSIAFLANQIAARLASQETQAQRSQLAAKAQALVNTLVIESLTDGVLVVDSDKFIKAANPAALDLLGRSGDVASQLIDLTNLHHWPELERLAQESLSENQGMVAELAIRQSGQSSRRIQVRTQVTSTQANNTERLCVIFLKDQREVEARMRKDKLASMARMSVAVAHEIRNPLAAITQANALLAEDILDPKHQQLIQMVRQNAHRLEKIVDEVLNVTRLQSRKSSESFKLAVGPLIREIVQEWTSQSPGAHSPLVNLVCPHELVLFEVDHLRQVLINLLDNARRYASQEPEAIQLHLELDAAGKTVMSVWSDASPMDHSVESHLFEPFFSSESRSTGLGLYICRELCEGHGALIAYARVKRLIQDAPREGNEFTVTFRSASPPPEGQRSPVSTPPRKWPSARP